jgi:hypothetical protein
MNCEIAPRTPENQDTSIITGQNIEQNLFFSNA